MKAFVPHDEERYSLDLKARKGAIVVVVWKYEDTERDYSS
jgi:hypothetical protein